MTTTLTEMIKITEVEMHTIESYEEMLDDCYEDVNIAGLSYSTSHALKTIDPIAFRCGFNDYQEYEERFICPECNEEHEDFEEAVNCCMSDQDLNSFVNSYFHEENLYQVSVYATNFPLVYKVWAHSPTEAIEFLADEGIIELFNDNESENDQVGSVDCIIKFK